MANQKKIDVVGDETQSIAYVGVGEETLAVHDKGQEPGMVPPPGTVYVQETMTVTNVVLNGKPANGYLTVDGPRTFLRGKHVLAGEFYRQLPECAQRALDDMVIQGSLSAAQVMRLAGVLVKGASGDYIAGISLESNDVPPPEGASEYAVGESPEELAEADAKADPEWEEGFDDDEEAAAREDEYGLTKADYAAGATVGICPFCLRTHGLRSGIVGLTDEEAQAERQRRAGEVPANLVLDEIGGES